MHDTITFISKSHCHWYTSNKVTTHKISSVSYFGLLRTVPEKLHIFFCPLNFYFESSFGLLQTAQNYSRLANKTPLDTPSRSSTDNLQFGVTFVGQRANRNADFKTCAAIKIRLHYLHTRGRILSFVHFVTFQSVHFERAADWLKADDSDRRSVRFCARYWSEASQVQLRHDPNKHFWNEHTPRPTFFHLCS